MPTQSSMQNGGMPPAWKGTRLGTGLRGKGRRKQNMSCRVACCAREKKLGRLCPVGFFYCCSPEQWAPPSMRKPITEEKKESKGRDGRRGERCRALGPSLAQALASDAELLSKVGQAKAKRARH